MAEQNVQFPSGMATLAANSDHREQLQPWFKGFVRVGYAAKGTIYLLIGTLAVRLALGAGGRLTDSSGVLETVDSLPFGTGWLALIGAGLLAYAGWEIAEAVADTRRKGSTPSGWGKRAVIIAKALVYALVGVEAIQLATGNGSSSQNPDEVARSAMQFPFGGFLLGLVGAAIAIYGLTQIWRAWQAQVGRDLDVRALRGEGRAWVIALGRAGVGARGVILTLIGAAIARAGFGSNPSEADGVTDAMWALFTQPYGKWLLAAVAAGLMCYGAFQIIHARYARL